MFLHVASLYRCSDPVLHARLASLLVFTRFAHLRIGPADILPYIFSQDCSSGFTLPKGSCFKPPLSLPPGTLWWDGSDTDSSCVSEYLRQTRPARRRGSDGVSKARCCYFSVLVRQVSKLFVNAGPARSVHLATPRRARQLSRSNLNFANSLVQSQTTAQTRRKDTDDSFLFFGSQIHIDAYPIHASRQDAS